MATLRNLFKKTAQQPDGKNGGPEVPRGLWRKCNKCGAAIYTDDVLENHYICPKCGGYFRMHARRRVEMIADNGTFEEWDAGLPFSNPLQFSGYERKVREIQERTGLEEAVLTGKASIGGHGAVLCVMDARFLMASMGHIVGEKITRAVERATDEKLPVIIFACSGGARMQEGMISLMQMAKTAAALKRHSEAGLLYISVLTEPTTGGVTASFAMLGDIHLAEPGALIGFAGPRVIEQTIRQKLPEGFQRAEFQLEHGFVDAIVTRDNMKVKLAQLLALHEKAANLSDTASSAAVVETGSFSGRIQQESEAEAEQMSAWERVKRSRMAERPTGLDYIRQMFTDFVEFHGDRFCKDDPAVVGGLARFEGRPVTVIAQQKGRDTKENIRRNFGMPSPEGYRKALRLMKQAEKFGRPVICFVDTPGAFCGLEAEERGQGEAIARNLFEMADLKIPVLSVVIGEGGSGGALAMAVADEVWMLQNSIYSILSPEGFATILWKDSSRADEAAEVMQITAADLEKLEIIDRIIEECQPATQENLPQICDNLKTELERFLKVYSNMDNQALAERRYQRFRKF